MIYKLNMNIKPNPLLPWIYIFGSLSIKQFQQVYETLNFPVKPTDHLRQIAHDFVLTLQTRSRDSERTAALDTLFHSSNPESISFDLLGGIPLNSSYIEKRDALFTNTFSYLEQIGLAEITYLWGKETHTYLKYADRQKYNEFETLSSWFRLLREWAILEWLKQPILSNDLSHGLYSADWNILIDKYIPIYTRKPEPSLEHLPLSKETFISLQQIILHYETTKLNFETTMDKISEAPLNVWEIFALKACAVDIWIRLEGENRINVQAWNMVLNTLTAKEMSILKDWALKHKILFADFEVPLPDFRVDNS